MRVLVTGAGTRVGQTIAMRFAAENAQIAVHFRSSKTGAEETCLEIARRGGVAVPLEADLTQKKACEELVENAVRALGGLDILVLSAANFERVELGLVDEDAWSASMKLNLEAPLWLALAAAPHLKNQTRFCEENLGVRPCIVAITCTSATQPFRDFLPYVVSKGALRQLVRTLAVELAPDIRVNAVAPGTVLPPSNMSAFALAKLRERIPLAYEPSADDVADAVHHLVIQSFATGTEIIVDGGRVVTFGDGSA